MSQPISDTLANQTPARQSITGMNRIQFLFDRTAVLFLGVAAGVAIGVAFGNSWGGRHAVLPAPVATPIANAPPAIAPPPPASPTAQPEAKPEAATPAPRGVVAEVPATVPVVAPPQGSLLATARAGGTVRVGVFGDSFGDGVWSALYRLLPAKDGYHVEKFSQQSTGFTRYRSLNLEAHDDGRIGTAPLDVAVIAFGANDVQGVCDGGHCGALMGSYWQQVIGRRITSYVAMLRRHGAMVYWVGLPAMRDPDFDADTSAMETFYAGLMHNLNVPYLDIRPFTVDDQGHYQAYYLASDGTQKLLRAGDGIHMSMNGYLRISRGLASRIRATVAAARSVAPAPTEQASGQSAS